MLKEMLEYLFSQVRSKETKVVEFDRYKDRIHTYPNGDADIEGAAPLPRNHNVEDFETLAAVTAHGESAVVWANRSAVVLVLDNKDMRRNTAKVSLAYSPQLAALQSLGENGKDFDQKALLTWLRTKFSEHITPATLVDNLRLMRVTTNTEGVGELQRTKVSVGKSAMAEFHGVDKLPEWVTFTVPVWQGKFGCMVTITVALDLDPEKPSFKLTPKAGAIETAIQGAELALCEALRKVMPATVPVYYGSP